MGLIILRDRIGGTSFNPFFNLPYIGLYYTSLLGRTPPFTCILPSLTDPGQRVYILGVGKNGGW